MEENEWAFCSLWSKKIKINCATALINPKLTDDYFFNRATTENCEIPCLQVANVFWKAGIDCHLYFKVQPPKCLCTIDTMYVLRLVKNDADLNSRIKVRLSKSSDVTTWIDLFCRSFSVPEWKDEVSRIIRANTNKIDLLLAYKGSTPAGCAALFKKSDLIGLYCLGTVPMQRSANCLCFCRHLVVKNCLACTGPKGLKLFIRKRFAQYLKRLEDILTRL